MSDEFNFTVSKGSKALGIDPRTLAKRIQAANLKPSGSQNGFDTYFMGEMAKAAFTNQKETTGYVVEKLSPKQLLEHYSALKRQRELMVMEGELIEYDKAAEKFAEQAQSFGKFFPTFIDDLEQTQLFTVEQLNEMQILCDESRRAFAQSEF